MQLDERAHLDAARTTHTTARLAQCEEPLREGIAYLAAMAAVNGATDGGVDGGVDDDVVVVVDDDDEE